MNESAHRDAVSIDVQFGAIRFIREEASTFAVIAVDVTILDTSSGADDTVQMEVKFAAKPETETILAIVEKGRRCIVDRLRTSAEILGAKSSEALLYGDGA